MEKRIGSELERLLASAPPARPTTEIDVSARRLFFNEERLKLFVFLHYRPCAALNHIAEFLGLSRTAAQWHASALTKAKYIAARKAGNWNVFLPPDLLAPGEEEMFACLNHKLYRGLFVAAMQDPGVTLTQASHTVGKSVATAQRTADELARLGLVEKARDGRATRLYTTGRFRSLEAQFLQRAPVVKGAILQTLELDGVRPEVILQGDDWMEVSLVTAKAARSATRFPLNPYKTILGE